MISPDTKDWTWVLDRACPECGYDSGAWPRESLSSQISSNAQEWLALHEAGRIAPGPAQRSRWSSLEYAAHVRDVYFRFDQRLSLMLSVSDPTFENWDQDASAIEERYNDQDPAAVLAQLVSAAAVLVQRIDQIGADEWERPGRRSNGSTFTVESLLRYLVHDPVHHLWDVTNDPTNVSA